MPMAMSMLRKDLKGPKFSPRTDLKVLNNNEVRAS